MADRLYLTTPSSSLSPPMMASSAGRRGGDEYFSSSSYTFPHKEERGDGTMSSSSMSFPVGEAAVAAGLTATTTAGASSSSYAAIDADLIEHRRRLLEVGRADVHSLLRDISEKYSNAIYYRDVEIGQLRAQVLKLEARLEDARLGATASDGLKVQLEDTITSLKAEVVGAATSMATQRDEHHAALVRYEALLKEKDATIAKLEDKVKKGKAARREAAAAADGALDALGKEMASLKAKVEASHAAAHEEKRRSDHYYKALKHSEAEAMDVARRMEEIAAQHKDRHHSREWLEESLRLQLLNTRRLLSVMAYMGTPEGAQHAQSLGRSIHAVASGGYQYIPHGGTASHNSARSPTAPSTVVQDLQEAIKSYSEAEAAITRRYLPQYYGKHGGGGGGAAEPFRSLHAEKDRWVPSEAVAAMRHFHQQHFPNAAPDLFYGLLLQVATVMRDLCGLSPLDLLMRRVEEREAAALRRFGLHDNRHNAPHCITSDGAGKGGSSNNNTNNRGVHSGAMRGLDHTKQSFEGATKGHYYTERALALGGANANVRGSRPLTAAEELRLSAIAEAVQGLLLVRRNVSKASAANNTTGTVVMLAPTTVEEVCGAAVAALEDEAARIHRTACEEGVGTASVNGHRHSNSPRFPTDERLPIVLSTMSALFGSVQDGSSRTIQLLKGITDASAHFKDAMHTLVGDIERSRRAVAVSGSGGGGGVGPSSATIASSASAELSGPYAILKAHVGQAVERYTTEVTGIARAAESNALALREKATKRYHQGLAQSKVEALGPHDVFVERK